MFDVASARLLSVGSIRAEPGWAMSSHAHHFWEFIYFLKGTGRIEFPRITIRPASYYLVVYPPGLPHAEYSDPYDPEETIFLSVEVNGDAPQGAHLLLPDTNGEIGWLCKRMFDEFQKNGATSLAHAYNQAFLCLVERTSECGVPIRHDTVDLAVQYLHSNYSRDISLDELASIACVSKTHLAHCFREKLDISPLRYLQHIRIEEAKRLLATTQIPINEIASMVGFSDPLYFSRVLKTVTGHAPTAFRQTRNCASQSIYLATESIPELTQAEV